MLYFAFLIKLHLLRTQSTPLTSNINPHLWNLSFKIKLLWSYPKQCTMYWNNSKSLLIAVRSLVDLDWNFNNSFKILWSGSYFGKTQHSWSHDINYRIIIDSMIVCQLSFLCIITMLLEEKHVEMPDIKFIMVYRL